MTAAGTGGPVPVPAGWRLRPDPSLRARAGGLVIAGGSPFRVLRL
ncbi:MAG: hypothetical protein JWP18_309, partial [Solirubrobacterales bacterium]|nr:hypothetical protein [Solirubrobacterales bacterium]